jgi:hypothetical protein
MVFIGSVGASTVCESPCDTTSGAIVAITSGAIPRVAFYNSQDNIKPQQSATQSPQQVVATMSPLLNAPTSGGVIMSDVITFHQTLKCWIRRNTRTHGYASQSGEQLEGAATTSAATAAM